MEIKMTKMMEGDAETTLDRLGEDDLCVSYYNFRRKRKKSDCDNVDTVLNVLLYCLNT